MQNPDMAELQGALSVMGQRGYEKKHIQDDRVDQQCIIFR
jgi:hypothetical protein